jgi:tetratricopeptide (TPR) repeat protein
VFTIAAFLARRPRRPADEYMSAERLAAELVKLNSGSANYRSVHGQVLLRLGRFDDAAAQFLQLLEIVKKPGPPGPGSLGVPGAQTEPTPSTEMLEMSPQALAGLALAHYGAGRVDDARRRLDEAREAQRTLARLVTERGDTAPTPHFLVLEAEATIGKQP